MKVKQILIGAEVAALAVGGALAPAVTASAVTPAGVSAFNASKLPADWYSSSTNPSQKTAPAGGVHTDSAQAFSCHLHANAPTSNGGHKAIGYGAYQQCTGTGIYNQQVCAELLGIDYYGGRTVRGPERCNYGSGPQTVSVQPTVSCPAGSAYEYVTEARVIDDTETGEHRGSAESVVTAGSELC